MFHFCFVRPFALSGVWRNAIIMLCIGDACCKTNRRADGKSALMPHDGAEMQDGRFGSYYISCVDVAQPLWKKKMIWGWACIASL